MQKQIEGTKTRERGPHLSQSSSNWTSGWGSSVETRPSVAQLLAPDMLLFFSATVEPPPMPGCCGGWEANWPPSCHTPPAIKEISFDKG